MKVWEPSGAWGDGTVSPQPKVGTIGLPGPRENVGISRGSRKVLPERIMYGGPETWGLGRGVMGAERKVRNMGGHFSGVPMRTILGPYKTG